MTRSRSGAALLAVAAALAFAPAAAADGDPASDILPGTDLFAPYDAGVPSASAAQLSALLRDARTKGKPIKVALVFTRADLGSVPVLFGRPAQYAKFLGQEINYTYRGLLLVVMPNGYGVYHGGKPTAKEARALTALPPPQAGGKDIGLAAIPAVRAVAAPLELVAATPAPSSGGVSNKSRDRLVIGGAVLVGVLVLVALAGLRRRP